MSLIIKSFSIKNTQKTIEQEPFKVLYNYRKTKMLRKMRQMRKQKLQRQKRQQKMMIDAIRREQQSLINRNMFQDDGQWQLCCENFKDFKDQYMNESSTNQEQTHGKSRNEIISQILAQIPIVEKKELYVQSFECFQFKC